MKKRNPLASVIVPTYNHSELLAKTLENLARQNFPVGQFEVIVANDGSSDGTESVTQSFSGRMQVKYYFQEDLGFRVAAARNGGARLASAPLLIFLDTGSMVGPDFVVSHLAAHEGRSGQAVVGLSYGYNPEAPMQGVDMLLQRNKPEDVISSHKDLPEFQDIRYPIFAKCGFEMSRMAVPWVFFLTGNCSVGTDDFWNAGGFDEDLRGWGGEDVDLGYRLHKNGVRFVLSDAVSTVVFPHERDTQANDEEFKANMSRILAKAPEPMVEIGWGVVDRCLFLPWEEEAQKLIAWRDDTRNLNTYEDISRILEELPYGQRVAVIGCGGRVPDELDSAVLADFDADLLRQALRDSGHSGYHAVGIRTTIPDNAVDSVIITSRLSGLWPTWGKEIEREARRIGRFIWRPDALYVVGRPLVLAHKRLHAGPVAGQDGLVQLLQRRAGIDA